MADLKVVSPAEYRTARIALLAKEKDLTRAREALNTERQALPVTEVAKVYRFSTLDDKDNKTEVSLAELFAGRRQLIVYHFMFDPAWDAGCEHCSVLGDSVPVHLQHMHARSTSFVMVSRAPIEKIAAYKKRMGWSFPWVSSEGSDFNYDFHTTQDEKVVPVEYNYKTKEELEQRGFGFMAKGEWPGHSCFIMGGGKMGEEGKIYHTYSTYARGSDPVVNTFLWLEMTKLGRLDQVEDRHADEYTQEELQCFL